jgi:hypothetical protein
MALGAPGTIVAFLAAMIAFKRLADMPSLLVAPAPRQTIVGHLMAVNRFCKLLTMAIWRSYGLDA